MNIIQQIELAIPDVKVIRFEKFNDSRGYFSETYNRRAIEQNCSFLESYTFEQTNESFSFANTLRGLHYQAGMGKLVRLIYGKMIDFALDLRKNSPTYKYLVGYELQSTCDYGEWIWLPENFAHGIWLLENSMIEYYCTALHIPNATQTISFFSKEINWDICDDGIKELFTSMNKETLKIKESDCISTYLGF